MQKTLISIIGSTGIGKTKLAIEMAKHFGTEIISCDSRQFFKEMKIGTAVPSEEELAEVKHHFIQNISIHEKYSVGDFERDGLAFLDNYFETNDICVMVGGSGLYEKAITVGFDEFPEVDPKIREDLNNELAEFGIEKLQKERDDLLEIASVLSWCNHGVGCPQGRVISEPDRAFRLIPCTCGFSEAVAKLRKIQDEQQ